MKWTFLKMNQIMVKRRTKIVFDNVTLISHFRVSGNVNCAMTNIRLAPGLAGRTLSSGQTLLSAPSAACAARAISDTLHLCRPHCRHCRWVTRHISNCDGRPGAWEMMAIVSRVLSDCQEWDRHRILCGQDTISHSFSQNLRSLRFSILLFQAACFFEQFDIYINYYGVHCIMHDNCPSGRGKTLTNARR